MRSRQLPAAAAARIVVTLHDEEPAPTYLVAEETSKIGRGR